MALRESGTGKGQEIVGGGHCGYGSEGLGLWLGLPGVVYEAASVTLSCQGGHMRELLFLHSGT